MTEKSSGLKSSLKFVQSTAFRWKVMLALPPKGGKTATQISGRIVAHRSQVSRTLRELSEAGLVECTTPNKHKGRLYALTDTGREIRKELGAWGEKQPLEQRVANTLDELSIPYARNVKLNPEGPRDTADFVIQDGFEPKMAIVIVDFRSDMPGSFGDILTWADKWKEETENLKSALILTGKSKEDILEEEKGCFRVRASSMRSSTRKTSSA